MAVPHVVHLDRMKRSVRDVLPMTTINPLLAPIIRAYRCLVRGWRERLTKKEKRLFAMRTAIESKSNESRDRAERPAWITDERRTLAKPETDGDSEQPREVRIYCAVLAVLEAARRVEATRNKALGDKAPLAYQAFLDRVATRAALDEWQARNELHELLRPMVSESGELGLIVAGHLVLLSSNLNRLVVLSVDQIVKLFAGPMAS
jgi:hypothetical protein